MRIENLHVSLNQLEDCLSELTRLKDIDRLILYPSSISHNLNHAHILRQLSCLRFKDLEVVGMNIDQSLYSYIMSS